MSSEKKIVVVFGATGAQGGSVVAYLQKDPQFNIRAVSRNPDSAAAKALAAKGIEVVKAEASDLQSCIKVMKGAWGVFAVTDYHATYFTNGRKAEEAQAVEEQQGRNIIDAAVKNDIKIFVYSTLDRTNSKCFHFASKANINDYLIKSGLPRVSVYTSWYYENLFKLGMTKAEDGSFNLDWMMPPDTYIAGMSVRELGGWILPLFQHPEKYIGKDIHTLGEYLTVRQLVQTLSMISGRKVTVPELTWEEFHSDAYKAKSDIDLWTNSATWVDDEGKNHNRTPLRNAELSKSVFPEASTFEQWCRNDDQLKEFMGGFKA